MGGAVSKGQDNDELVDNLIESRYIRTKAVEKVFRAIDRADYFLSSHRESAYKDFAWKHGNIHLSAPCVYSEVMEGLALKPGLSFLNLGSGTGYFSTMAGLILTQTGINHGIELHEDCLKYANDRIEEFKQKSLALDEFDFCEPRFIQGNCLSLVPGRRYDRVYCGATCPESHEAFIKQLVKVGGILVMPYKDHLLRVERTDENTWISKNILPVSFATLVVPSSGEQNLIHLPECDPMSLQELCRWRIRCRLRKIILFEHSDLEFRKPILAERRRTSSKTKTLRRLVIPIFEESDESLPDEDDDYTGRTRLLLNVDAHSGEAITTTLQLVRAVIQPNIADENEANEETQAANTNRTSHQSSIESIDSTSSNSTEIQSNHDDKQFPSTETYQISDSSTSSDSVCDKIEDSSSKTADNGNERCRRESNLESYLTMSESDSDQDQEYVMKQRHKIAKREKTDNSDRRVIDDFETINDDTSSSSNTHPSNSEIMETDYQTYDMFGDNSHTYPLHRPMNNREQRLGLNPLDPNMGHYIDSNAFSSYLKEKILQLPLPHALKIYLNYNRNL